MENLRVYLTDDHPVVLAGLKALVNSQPDMTVIGEAVDGQVAVGEIQMLLPDVAIMDISMPLLNGVQATRQLKQVCPKVRVVALTIHEDHGYLRQVLEAGASGFVLKRAAADELIRAIWTVARGGVYLDPMLTGKVLGTLVRRPSAQEVPQATNVSDREEEVLKLIAQGHSNKEIAAHLSISVKTVKTYKARSLEKLGLRSRADIVRYALTENWLQTS